MDLLTITQAPIEDNSIHKENYLTFYPETNNFRLSDEIRFIINSPEILIPSKGKVFIRGKYQIEYQVIQIKL